jgi:hypothetical protein
MILHPLRYLIAFVGASSLVFLFADDSWNTIVDAVARKVSGRSYSVADRLDQYGDGARAALAEHFSRAGVAYPPRALTLVGLKKEKRLELYAGGSADKQDYILAFPILAASGRAGPKLREGDLQVPEGLYKIESFNPNSQFHLSLRVNYPNAFDRDKARTEGRNNLGGDIMIHGSSVSIGCLAIGDSAIEQLFVLAADTQLKNIDVLIAPLDFRRTDLSKEDSRDLPGWTLDLYTKIKERLSLLSSPAQLSTQSIP